jgi:hypothetical protein
MILISFTFYVLYRVCVSSYVVIMTQKELHFKPLFVALYVFIDFYFRNLKVSYIHLTGVI